MSNELAPVEAQALTEHEAVIERGLNTFTEVGNALLAIRDGRLYRVEHDTFEDYCQERWGFNRHRASQLINAAGVVTNVTSAGLPAPTNEGQARELARVPQEQRAEVWQETLARTDGKPTAAAIRETYAPPQTVMPPPRADEPSPDTPEGIMRCSAGHLAARETVEDAGGCPYCLQTQGERNAATQARETLLRRQHDEREAEKRRQLDTAITEFPELEHYAERPEKAIALAANLRAFPEPERPMRRETLAKAIAAERRQPGPPQEPDGPDYYELADAIFLALNTAAAAVARSQQNLAMAYKFAKQCKAVHDVWIEPGDFFGEQAV